MGWDIGSGVFRGGMFLRAVQVVIMPRHTPYEERRDVWRAVRVVIRPRHTPYKEAWLLEKTRRVCEPGRGELDSGVVKPAPRTHQGLVTGWDIGSGVFRGGVFLRAVQVVIMPRHTPYEEPRQNILRAAQVIIRPRHTPYEEAKQGCFARCQA
jgi:hypothetical protein